jgi:hypothetical protein
VGTPEPADVIDAMKVHRIRLGKDQGLRPWEPANTSGRNRAAAASLPSMHQPTIE